MSTQKDKYYMKFLKNLVDDNNCNGASFSNKNIWQAVSKLMEEIEA